MKGKKGLKNFSALGTQQFSRIMNMKNEYEKSRKAQRKPVIISNVLGLVSPVRIIKQ